MCAKTKMPPTGPQLEHAIKRNFGGLDDKDLKPHEVFMKKIEFIGNEPTVIGIKEEVRNRNIIYIPGMCTIIGQGTVLSKLYTTWPYKD